MYQIKFFLNINLFSNACGQTSKEISLHFTNPSDFKSISSEQLWDALSEITMKKFAINKIHEISSITKNPFGITFCLDSFAQQLKLLIEQINFIKSQVKDVEQQINTFLEKINSSMVLQ